MTESNNLYILMFMNPFIQILPAKVLIDRKAVQPHGTSRYDLQSGSPGWHQQSSNYTEFLKKRRTSHILQGLENFDAPVSAKARAAAGQNPRAYVL